MIDTMRFEIFVTEEELKSIISKSIEFTSFDHNDDVINYKFYKTEIDLGSYDKNINFFITEDSNLVKMEFSIPKLFYGHNVFLVYPEQVKPILDSLRYSLINLFGSFPEVEKWSIVRIDLCYAWKFQKPEYASTVLSILKSYNYTKKHKQLYDTSIMLLGATFSLKFYLKEDEYYKHDFKTLKRNPTSLDFAYDVLEYSRGVLRFEVTLRKKAIKSHFEVEELYTYDLSYDKILQLLKWYFMGIIKSAPSFMTSVEVMETLKNKYCTTKALHLWQFYKIYHSDNPEDQKILKDSYDRHSIWYNLKQLTVAGVGLPKKDGDIDFILDIPSSYCVNDFNQQDAVAEATQTKLPLDTQN